MPFKSEKQRAYLYANEPQIAKKWAAEHGNRIQKNKGGAMPTVGNKKFAYTPKGHKEAVMHAKKTGQPVMKKAGYKKGGRVKMAKGGYSSFGYVKGFDYAGDWVNSDGYPSGGTDVKD